MLIAVIGAKLQGLEACYLASKAGFDTVLIDKARGRVAEGLCGRFMEADITRPTRELIEALKGCDMVLPALENSEALAAIEALSAEHGLITAFDFRAYETTSSKKKSDALFLDIGVRAPKHYPDCMPPYIFKPSSASGSAGVRVFDSEAALSAHIASLPKGEEFVLEEFVHGPSYSIEVIGEPGAYKVFEITEIHMDPVFDCCRVSCPVPLDKGAREELERFAIRIAEALRLRGIMDVETIFSMGKHYVLEIDARLPSQTPSAVFASTGVNFIKELAALFTGKPKREEANFRKHASFEHIALDGAVLAFPGEHAIAPMGPMALRAGLFGADEVLWDGREPFCGTFINAANTEEELSMKRGEMLRALKLRYNI